MKLMSFMPLPNGEGMPAEGNGVGIPRMIHEMTSHALAEPDFEAHIDSFKVILTRAGVEIAENQQWLSQTINHDPDSHEQAVALIVRRNGRTNVKSIRNQLGLDSDEVRDILRKLADDNVIRWTGTDEVTLVRRLPRWTPQQWHENILAVLDPDRPMSLRDIAQALGRKSANTRIYIKELVENGEIVATAGPKSKNRMYLLGKQEKLPLSHN